MSSSKNITTPTEPMCYYITLEVFWSKSKSSLSSQVFMIKLQVFQATQC